MVLPRTIWLTSLVAVSALSGCYQSHRLEGASPPPDAGRRDARADDGSVDGGSIDGGADLGPPPRCDRPTLDALHQLSETTPPDQSLGGLVATRRGAIVGWTSSNDPIEWDRPHRVRAIGPTGAPLADAVDVLPEPSGWHYAMQPNLAPMSGDRVGVLAFSAGHGCQLATVGATGRVEAMQTISPGPCWGLWSDDGGVFLNALTRLDSGGPGWAAVLFVEDGDAADVNPPEGIERPGVLAFVDRPGRREVMMARAGDGVVATGVWRVPSWSRRGEVPMPEGTLSIALAETPAGYVLATLGADLRLARLGSDGSFRDELLPIEGAAPVTRSGFALRVVGNEAHLLHVEGERFETRLVQTRVALDAPPGAPPVGVAVLHTGPFISDPRVVPTGGEMVVAFTELVPEVGHQVFASHIICADR